MTKLSEWFGQLVGSTVAQSSFYADFFGILFESPLGRVYNEELTGWGDRSKSKWIKRMIDLEVIERKREGFRGKVYYRMSPQFLAYLNKLWALRKKLI